MCVQLDKYWERVLFALKLVLNFVGDVNATARVQMHNEPKRWKLDQGNHQIANLEGR